MAEELEGLVDGHKTSEEYFSIVKSSVVPQQDAKKHKIINLLFKMGIPEEISDELFSNKSLDQLIFDRIYSKIKSTDELDKSPTYYFVGAYLNSN